MKKIFTLIEFTSVIAGVVSSALALYELYCLRHRHIDVEFIVQASLFGFAFVLFGWIIGKWDKI